MTDDDDGHDDPMLRSMRAVWLSMRDEEPPQSGLSALLVAAREKAEQMRPKPSLWSRVLAGMRRPPVLALATVVVLLGGAVALTMRGNLVDGDHPKMQAPAMPSPMSPPAEPPATATGADQGDLEKTEDQAPPPVAQEAQPPARPRVTAPATPPRQRSPSVTAKPPAREPGASPERGFGGDGVAGRIEPAPPPPSPPPPAKSGEKKAEGKLSIATDDAGGGGEVAGAPMEDTSANAEAPRPQPPQPPAAQLAQQCETAAARGDCAAVRVIAERIKKLDGVVYRDRVQKNAAIARCLK